MRGIKIKKQTESDPPLIFILGQKLVTFSSLERSSSVTFTTTLYEVLI